MNAFLPISRKAMGPPAPGGEEPGTGGFCSPWHPDKRRSLPGNGPVAVVASDRVSIPRRYCRRRSAGRCSGGCLPIRPARSTPGIAALPPPQPPAAQPGPLGARCGQPRGCVPLRPAPSRPGIAALPPVPGGAPLGPAWPGPAPVCGESRRVLKKQYIELYGARG